MKRLLSRSKGTIIFSHPTYLKLLNGARQSIERAIDDLYKAKEAVEFGALASRASACTKSVY
jgi:hypothetical protein